MSKDTHDELSDLLDSFQNDDTMEKKIEDFARKKERKTRTERNKEEILIKSVRPREEEKGPVLIHESEMEEETNDHGGTMVFSKNKIEEDISQPSHTVVMDNQEIQTLIDENKGPSLHRESSVKTKKAVSNQKKPDKKKIAIIAGSVLGIVLIGGIVFGTVHFISSSLKPQDTQVATHDNAFNDLKKYIENLGDDTQGLTGYESTYSKLSDAQKAQINELLKNKTGKTFEQLISDLKSQKIEDSKNNNTEVAEQKANLKDQIASLQSDLAQAKNDLSTASTQFSQAEASMNSADQARNDAAAALQTAQQNYDSQTSTLNAQIADLQAKIAEVENENPDYSDEANAELSDLHQQLTTAQNKLNSIDYSAVTNAQNAYTNADNAYNNAYNTYSQASNAVTNAQSRVDSINSHIASLQQQLNALQ